MPAKLRGIFYTLGSAACLSVTFVASKQALLELSPLALAPFWFGIAFSWGIGYYLLQPHKTPLAQLKQRWKSLFLLGLSSSVANYFLFVNIKLGDPTIIAFFSRATTIFALLMGVWLLRERMSQFQWLGAVVAIAGTGVMTYQGGRLIWLVLALALTSSFFHALTSYIAKRNVTHISPIILNLARTLGLTICLGTLSLFMGELAWPSPHALLWIIGGAFFGPFLSYILFYKGIVTLDISQAAILRASQPLFVALYSYILFGQIISQRQFIGGFVILLGVALILWPRRRPHLPQQLRSSTSIAHGDAQNVIRSQDGAAHSTANL